MTCSSNINGVGGCASIPLPLFDKESHVAHATNYGGSASAPMNEGVGSTPMRSRLPALRASETFDFEVGGLHYHATISRCPEADRIAEIFFHLLWLNVLATVWNG
jgi:hypothetical protein